MKLGIDVVLSMYQEQPVTSNSPLTLALFHAEHHYNKELSCEANQVQFLAKISYACKIWEIVKARCSLCYPTTRDDFLNSKPVMDELHKYNTVVTLFNSVSAHETFQYSVDEIVKQLKQHSQHNQQPNETLSRFKSLSMHFKEVRIFSQFKIM